MTNGLPSVMQHTFSMVPEAEIQRSSFKRNQLIELSLFARGNDVKDEVGDCIGV